MEPRERGLERDVREFVTGLYDETLKRVSSWGREKAAVPTLATTLLYEPIAAGVILWTIVEGHDNAAMEAGWVAGIEGVGRAAADVLIDPVTLLMDLDFNPENATAISHMMGKDLMVRTIPQAWHDVLRDLLDNALREGSSVEELTRILEERFSGLKTWQARRIAQTEIIGSYNVGQYAAFQDAGVERSRWIATLDDKVRDSHAAVHGEVVVMGMPFSNGLLYPGQTGAPAAAIINCRCTVAPVVTVPDWPT